VGHGEGRGHALGRRDRRREDNQTAEEVERAAPYSWPLHSHDLLAMWLLERELARALPAAAP
jgi:hypothetical protein